MSGNIIKELVRKALRARGLEVIQQSQHPASNLMGLRSLEIRTFIDVGANTGQFATEAARWFPGVRLYSFEPIRSAFETLQHRTFPGVKSFKAFNFALGDADEEV